MGDTPKLRLIRNAIFSSTSWVLTVLVALIATPYFVAKMGTDGYGVFVLLTSMVGYYGLLDLGLGQGITKFIAQFKATGEHEEINKSINAALVTQFIFGLVGSTVLVLFARPLVEVLNVPANLIESGESSVRLASAGFLFTVLAGTFNSVIMGLQRYDLSSAMTMSAAILSTVITALLLSEGYGLYEAIAVTVLSALCLLISAFLCVRNLLPTWRISPSVDWHLLRSIFGFSGYAFVIKLLDMVNNYFGRFIIGIVLGPTAVAVYTVPSRLLTAVWGILGNAFSILFPYASELGAMSDSVAVKKMFVRSASTFTAIAFPLFSCLIIFSGPVMSLWMGETFARQSSTVLSILAAGALITTLTSVPVYVSMGLGHSRIIALFSVLSLIVYVPLVVSLSRLYAEIGAAIAIAFMSLQGFLLTPQLIKIVLQSRFSTYIKEVYSFHLLPLMICAFAPLLWQYVNSTTAVFSVILMMTYLLLYYGSEIHHRLLPVADILSLARFKRN